MLHEPLQFLALRHGFKIVKANTTLVPACCKHGIFQNTCIEALVTCFYMYAIYVITVAC